MDSRKIKPRPVLQYSKTLRYQIEDMGLQQLPCMHGEGTPTPSPTRNNRRALERRQAIENALEQLPVYDCIERSPPIPTYNYDVNEDQNEYSVSSNIPIELPMPHFEIIGHIIIPLPPIIYLSTFGNEDNISAYYTRGYLGNQNENPVDNMEDPNSTPTTGSEVSKETGVQDRDSTHKENEIDVGSHCTETQWMN